MQAIRQLGGGVIIAIISVALVLGGIVLSLAENIRAAATPTLLPPTLPLSFPTPTPTQTPLLQTATATGTALASSSPTATLALVTPTTCTPPAGWVHVFVATGDTLYALAQRYKISPEALSAANCLASFNLSAGYALYVPPVPTVTIIPCGPPAGWVKTLIVAPGDTLFRIALSYGTTYPQLQRANCMGGSTTIYAGQKLWVPNVPTRTPIPGTTTIPEFPTETPTATATSLPTSTSTELPTATITAFPTAAWTSVPTSTDTPTPPPSQ